MKKSYNGTKAGVIPVVATIILISGTLVLALGVGGYMFGLLGSNVETITLTSAILYSGIELGNPGGVSQASSYLLISLNNPGISDNDNRVDAYWFWICNHGNVGNSQRIVRRVYYKFAVKLQRCGRRRGEFFRLLPVRSDSINCLWSGLQLFNCVR